MKISRRGLFGLGGGAIAAAAIPKKVTAELEPLDPFTKYSSPPFVEYVVSASVELIKFDDINWEEE